MRIRSLAVPLFAVLASVTLASAVQAQVTFEVTVTNLTKGQTLSNPVIISHDAEFALFTESEAASTQLANLAEDANNAPLFTQLGTDPNVFDFVLAATGLPPGESVTTTITASGLFRLITVAGMLVTTNDGFYAARNIMVGRTTGSITPAVAYDAGSEENNEDCAFIPGPPCGNDGVRTGTSEGFIHIHSGIHGILDLAPAELDWQNPVALISVQAVP